MYFLGFASVIWFGGIRIGGLSGIFNDRHYRMGHYERPPYSQDTVRSIYHLRELEVYRMMHITNSIDIFLSHDWPSQVWEYGNKQELLYKKKFLADDMASGKLGSPPLMHILHHLKPSFWFAAHLHVKFAAVIPHSQSNTRPQSLTEPDETLPSTSTRFLALDKVLPGRYVILH